jgi:pyrimidine-nucleoside phosphorylase
VTVPYLVLERKRSGLALGAEELQALVRGAGDGSWKDAELAAFLMAAAIRGLDGEETRVLTRAMLESGERWELRRDVPGVVDKHSTGGVGDKVSLVLAPLLASCGVPVAMLTGRSLGHTGGTADKLETIPGLRLELGRPRGLEVLRATGVAIGVATAEIAPADRRLYALRDRTATVDSLPLITASILSKKLAAGTAAVVFDVKTGNGAILADRDQARALARLLVSTCSALSCPARALLTDMSQPLGEWVGHTGEVREALDALEGNGPDDLREVTVALAAEAAELVGAPLGRPELERALDSGAARPAFDRWAAAQGADPAWLARPLLPLAPVEAVVAAPRAGVLAAVDTRRLGHLLAEAGAGRAAGRDIDPEVALRYRSRLGRRVEAGEELLQLYLRREDPALVERFAACLEIADEGSAPVLVSETIR